MIDDRRRFRDTVRELLYARILVAALAGAASGLPLLAWLLILKPSGNWWVGPTGVLGVVLTLAPLLLGIVVSPLCLAVPSAVAKRGKIVLPLAVLAIFLGTLVSNFARMHGGPAAMSGALFGVTGAALGVTEGLLERSIATTYSGLLGGALFGAASGLWGVGYLAYTFLQPGVAPPLAKLLAVSVVSCVALHLGIGLSLALGRCIRDLPERKKPAAGEEKS